MDRNMVRAGLMSALLVVGAGVVSSVEASSVHMGYSDLLGGSHGKSKGHDDRKGADKFSFSRSGWMDDEHEYEHGDADDGDRKSNSRWRRDDDSRKQVVFTLTDTFSGTSWTWGPGNRGDEKESLGRLLKMLRVTSESGRADYHFSVARVEVAAVPVPAAVWLFGSGLVGLMAVARRRK